MRKNLFNAKTLLLALFFVCLFSNIISAEEINYSNSYNYQYEGIQVSSLKYEPYPVNPGEYFDLWIQATIGTSAKSYAKFELIPEFPFSLDSNENATREYKDFSGDVLIHYKIRVDKNAVEGINSLKVRISTSDYPPASGSISSFDINVANAQTDFDLVVQDSTSSEVSLAIANIGKNTANSMIVRIPEQENFRVTGTNGQMVGNLVSGDYTLVGFNIVATGKPSISGKNLTVEVDYTDNIGERRSLLKEVQFNSAYSSNYTSGSMSGNFVRGQSTKSKNNYTLIGIILIILVILGFVYFKYSKKINSSFKKLSAKKPKTGSAEIPSWVKNFKEK